ncbi:MAG: RusA family crossover junction endodeoxyribonuclease [Jatrophihabitans sp.]
MAAPSQYCAAQMATLVGRLYVEALGEPKPQGSKRHVGGSRMVESSKALKPWRTHVQSCFEDALDRAGIVDAIDGPLAVEVTFTMRKPASAPKRRRTWPIARPDVDKLVRAVLDAGQAAGAYRDDAQVVRLVVDKVFPRETFDASGAPGVRVRLYQVVDAKDA